MSNFFSKVLDLGAAALTLIYAPEFLIAQGVSAAIANFAVTFA